MIKKESINFSEKDDVYGTIVKALLYDFDKIPLDVRDKLLIKLSEKDETAGDVAWAVAGNWYELSDNIRIELLIKLSEKQDASGAIIRILQNRFDKIPENLRNELLLKLSEKDTTAKAIPRIIASEYDKIPENIKIELLLKLSEKNETAGAIARIVEQKFDKLPANITNELLLRLAKMDRATEAVARIITKNFDKLPENERNLLSKFSENDNTAVVAAKIVAENLDKFPENVRYELLFKLCENDMAASYIGVIATEYPVSHTFKTFPEIKRNELLLRLSKKAGAAGPVAEIVAHDYEIFPDDVRNILKTFSENEETAKWVALAIYDYFRLPEKLMEELLLKLSEKDSASEIVAEILGKELQLPLPEDLRNLLFRFSENDKTAVRVAKGLGLIEIFPNPDDYIEPVRSLLRSLLFKFSENEKTAVIVSEIVRNDFENEFKYESEFHFSKGLRNELLLKLSEKEAAAKNVARIIVENFDELPDNIRNLLFKLSENENATKDVALFLIKNFDKIPENIRNELLIKLSEKNVSAKDVAQSLASNFDRIPENIRNDLILKLSEKEFAVKDITGILVKQFGKLPDNTRNLLFKLSENENVANDVALSLANNFDKLPENIRNELLLKLSEKEVAAEAISRILIQRFDKLPDNIRNLLFKLSENENAANGVALSLANNFDKLPENVRNELLLKLSEKEAASKDIARILIEHFDKLRGNIQNLLLKFSENENAANGVAFSLANNFDKLPENVRNELIIKLSGKKSAAKDITTILERNFNKLPDAIRNDLLLKFSNIDEVAGNVAKIISENFYKLPKTVRALLFKLSENDNVAGDVAQAIISNFKRLPDNVRILLYKLSENDKIAEVIAETIKENYNVLPENEMIELLFRLSENDNIVGILKKSNKLDKLPENVRSELLSRLRETSEITEEIEKWLPFCRKSLPPMAEIGEPTESSKQSPRYADFTFFNHDNKQRDKKGERVQEGHTLQVMKWYQLEVAVRVKPIGIPLKGSERAPIREPKQKQDVKIMVTAEAIDERLIEIEEPVKTLKLPPHGDSIENALFSVRPLCKSTSSNDLATIRIRLYYEFNLIEVAVISAEVSDSSARSKLGFEKPLSFEQERLEHEYLDFDNIFPRAMHIDVAKKGEHYQFHFMFQNAVNQEIIFSAPVHLPSAELEDSLVRIRRVWYEIAMSGTYTKQLEGDKYEFSKQIHILADVGRQLWIRMFRHELKSSIFNIGTWLEEHPLKSGAIIQVSLDKDAANLVFPWSLIYDRKVPEKDDEQNPDGFWGMRYCIEQKSPNMTIYTDELVHADKLKIGFMLHEEFRNKDKEISLMENLKARSAGKLEVTTPITDADECYNLLSNCDADILYFYTHGYTQRLQADIGADPILELFMHKYESLDSNSPLIEGNRLLYKSIKQSQLKSDHSWIELTNGRLYLEKLYENILSEIKSNPFVILNMCESAQVTPSLSSSFIHFFLTRGARGVIGTECPMTVEFAHPFAEKFLVDLLSGEQAGIALLNARRHFIEHKNPLGLAYTLFGLATVRFEPPRFNTITKL